MEGGGLWGWVKSGVTAHASFTHTGGEDSGQARLTEQPHGEGWARRLVGWSRKGKLLLQRCVSQVCYPMQTQAALGKDGPC